MIVSQPKAGKTTLLKEIANSVKINNPEMHMIILVCLEQMHRRLWRIAYTVRKKKSIE